MNKQEYKKPQICELNTQSTDTSKQTPSTIEGQNPGGNADPKFGTS